MGNRDAQLYQLVAECLAASFKILQLGFLMQSGGLMLERIVDMLFCRLMMLRIVVRAIF